MQPGMKGVTWNPGILRSFLVTVAQSCPTLCNPTVCSTPGFPVLHHLPAFCSNSGPLSWWCYLVLCHPLLLLPSTFPSIRVFSNESAHRIRGPKYWRFSFSFSISPSSEWILRVDFLQNGLVWSPCGPRDSQESSPTPQFESINFLSLTLLYGPTLTSIHDYWKNHSFGYTDLCQQRSI